MTATATTTTPSNLLRIADLTATQLTSLLDLADEMKNGPTWWTAARDGAAVACLFDESSPLSRASFEVAAHRLGMLPTLLRRTSCNSVAASRLPTPRACCRATW